MKHVLLAATIVAILAAAVLMHVAFIRWAAA